MLSVLQHSHAEFPLPLLAPAGRNLNTEASAAEPSCSCQGFLVGLLPSLSQGKVVHWA